MGTPLKSLGSPKTTSSKAERNPPSIMSTLSYAWNVHGTFNGDFISASGTTDSVDGVAEVHGTAGEGGPFNHSSWIWGGFGHYGLAYLKGGHKENPTEKYPYHMTRHWRARTDPTSGLLIMSPAPRVPGLAMSMSLPSTSSPKAPSCRASSAASTPLTGSPPREVTKKSMSGAPSPLKSRVVARTPPTFTSTCSFTSPASKSTATTGSWSTSLLSTTPPTGTTRRLLLLIPTGPGAMSPTRRLSPGT